MPAVARAQLPRGGGGGGRVRPEARLGDGLCGYFGRLQTALGATRPSLLERSSRPGKSNERKCRCVDLGASETGPAAARGSCRRRNLHRTMCLSRGVTAKSGKAPCHVREQNPSSRTDRI